MAQCQPNEEWVSRVVTDLVIGARLKFSERGSHLLKGLPLGFAVMKIAVEILGDLSAAIEALLWFGSATVRLKERNRLKRGLGTGFADDPKALFLVIYKQSRWNAGWNRGTACDHWWAVFGRLRHGAVQQRCTDGLAGAVTSARSR
jgi:hypothetical protein